MSPSNLTDLLPVTTLQKGLMTQKKKIKVRIKMKRPIRKIRKRKTHLKMTSMSTLHTILAMQNMITQRRTKSDSNMFHMKTLS